MTSTNGYERQACLLLYCALLSSTIFLLGSNKPPPDTKPEDMKPPGDCEDDAYARLNAEVDKFCKDKKNPVLACLQPDDCGVLAKKAIKFDDCIKARVELDTKCFRGGDDGHKKQTAELTTGRNRCLEYFTKKKCLPEQNSPVCQAVEDEQSWIE